MRRSKSLAEKLKQRRLAIIVVKAFDLNRYRTSKMHKQVSAKLLHYSGRTAKIVNQPSLPSIVHC